MFESVRELDAEELDTQEFLGLVSDLMKITKGVDVELTEADILADSPEFHKVYRHEVHRLLDHYGRRR